MSDRSLRLLRIYPDVAERLGVGRSTAYELVSRGDLSTVSIGARRLVPDIEVERYIARLCDAAGIELERDEDPAATPGPVQIATRRANAEEDRCAS